MPLGSLQRSRRAGFNRPTSKGKEGRGMGGDGGGKRRKGPKGRERKEEKGVEGGRHSLADL